MVFSIISITKKIKWLFFAIDLLGLFIDIPYSNWGGLIFLILFLIEPGAIQGLYQLFGILYINIIYMFKLPSKENYICKNSYILPFSGKWTVVNGGVDKKLSHSWSIVTQRYAYDFLIVNDEGKSFDGNGKSIKNYFCYGENIVAPADGIVLKLCNKYKDSRVDGKRAFCDAWDIRGNFIVIKHNDSEFSAIAHIMKDSFNVKIGDRVKQGEIIAKCGNSGNTSEPHIHFQLQTGKSFFLSAGLPIIFNNIKTEDSIGYKLFLEKLKIKFNCNDNLQKIDNNKYYIGCGLNVENNIVE